MELYHDFKELLELFNAQKVLVNRSKSNGRFDTDDG